MSVPNSTDGPLIKIVHCPMRDTAFRIRIPSAIHRTSIPQFVVDLANGVAEVTRVRIPQGTKAGDSIIIDLPKAGINFGVVLPAGRYGRFITVRVPPALNAFRAKKKVMKALTNGGDGDGEDHTDGGETALVPLEPDALVASNIEVQKVIREVFESIDVDGSGSIEAPEMAQLLRRLNRSANKPASVVFDEIDQNHDAVIDPREFETYILKQLAHASRCVRAFARVRACVRVRVCRAPVECTPRIDRC